MLNSFNFDFIRTRRMRVEIMKFACAVFFCFVALYTGPSLAAKIDWQDSELVEVRNILREWWKKEGPKPKLKCSSIDHEKAISRSQLLDDSQSRTFLSTFETLVLKGSDVPFFGVNESVIALRTKRAQVVVMSAKKVVNVYDFRNPFTGHHHYNFCEGLNCDRRTSITDGSDYGTYMLAGCMTFPDFVRRFYSRVGTAMAVTTASSKLFESVESIGGLFKHDVLFYKTPGLEPASPKKFRSNFWIERFEE